MLRVQNLSDFQSVHTNLCLLQQIHTFEYIVVRMTTSYDFQKNISKTYKKCHPRKRRLTLVEIPLEDFLNRLGEKSLVKITPKLV